eukprot:1710209-Pleurochrysis_carterae.AAC.1
MSHWQGFTAVYAAGGMYGISPTTRSNVPDRQLWSMWGFAPYLDVEMETMIYIRLPTYIGSRTRSSRLCDCT